MKKLKTRVKLHRIVYQKGMVDGIEAAIKVLELAIKQGFDLEIVYGMLLLGKVGLDLNERHPISAKTSGQAMRNIIRKMHERND